MSAGEQKAKSYEDTREIERLVESFETCVVPPAEFKHGAHLTVALWYLTTLPAPEAAACMREGLRRYTKHNNAEAAYNETITLFWLKLVGRFLERTDDSRPLAVRANELLATYNNSQLVFEYYSRDLIQTPEAKESWVEPDLKPLDF
ncbi:MAG TPA: hypothetical protein VJ842_12090 [Pyrinomonadaceae bacterium]|nr:hypothetical protein [Pyrinomonadaceae bacterium]